MIYSQDDHLGGDVHYLLDRGMFVGMKGYIYPFRIPNETVSRLSLAIHA